MFELVADEEVRLRPLSYREVPELYRLTDLYRDHLSTWLPWVRRHTLTDTYAFVDHSIAQQRRNEGFQAGIFYRHAIVGVIGYHKIDWDNRKTSLGYWLIPTVQGRGVMSRACSAMLDYAFFHLGLNRMEIRAAKDNIRSRRVAERLGFTQEGIIRQAEWLHDRFVDHVVYGLLAREWEQRSDRRAFFA
ncbi:MAG: GNAT family N-acetyltransferase [Hydrogenibacillus sp.]|nr:GNAT family N-acetyltransferase [Hydrogenibacillus sp.]